MSEFMNIILGGGLVGTVATIGSLRATVRKAKAEAMKAEAGAEAMRIDNAEHATRILMENIVKPLKDEFCETKKELARNTREMARLRKAIDTAGNCPHRDDCPVLDRLRESPKEHEPGSPDGNGLKSSISADAWLFCSLPFLNHDVKTAVVYAASCARSRSG